MNDEGNQGREREFGERIANSIRAIDQGPKKQITHDELQKLKAAAGRLNQLLNTAADADRQALKTAAARLDQMLKDIGKGKDIKLKRREPTDSDQT